MGKMKNPNEGVWRVLYTFDNENLSVLPNDAKSYKLS